MATFKVKALPLVWKRTTNVKECYESYFFGHDLLIEEGHSGGFGLYVNACQYNYFQTVDEAKEYAQTWANEEIAEYTCSVKIPNKCSAWNDFEDGVNEAIEYFHSENKNSLTKVKD